MYVATQLGISADREYCTWYVGSSRKIRPRMKLVSPKPWYQRSTDCHRHEPCLHKAGWLSVQDFLHGVCVHIDQLSDSELIFYHQSPIVSSRSSNRSCQALAVARSCAHISDTNMGYPSSGIWVVGVFFLLPGPKFMSAGMIPQLNSYQFIITKHMHLQTHPFGKFHTDTVGSLSYVFQGLALGFRNSTHGRPCSFQTVYRSGHSARLRSERSESHLIR